MRRSPALPILLVALGTAIATSGGAQESTNADAISRCAIEGVRVSLADAGDTTTVEISARLKPLGTKSASCLVDWTLVSLGTPEGNGAMPTIAIAQTFIDHHLEAPLVLADGVASAPLRAYRGDVTDAGRVVAIRFVLEGTSGGVRVEIPRAAFPRLTVPGARAERRVKSGRSGTARFGLLGDIPIVASAPGPAGGLGPTAAIDRERITAEMVPKEEGGEVVKPGSATTLDAFRDTLPRRVLDLSTSNDEAWDEIARRAYAAAVHGDPIVASIGVYTLAWLGSGLTLQATKISKTAGGPDTAVLPASVVDTIGDAPARLTKRYGAVGRLLPLGRPSTFRKALSAQPWTDPARAKAAKDAVARLGALGTETLASYVVPAIADETSPVDPPGAVIIPGTTPTEIEPMPSIDPSAVPSVTAPAKKHASSRPSHRRRWFGLSTALLAVAAIAYWLRRNS